MDLRRRLPAALLALPAFLAGSACSSYQDAISAAETGEILADLDAQVAAERAAAATAVPVRAPATLPPEDIPGTVDLTASLRIAARRNRELTREREGLVLSALTLLNARNEIGPRLFGSVRHALADTDVTRTTATSGVTLGATAVLPTGATATVTADATRFRRDGRPGDDTADGSITAKVSQPLLRGAGYESSHEQLTDAERQALYDVRQYELFRQDLALDVQQAYYGIVAQKQVVRNRELKLESLEFLKRRSERLFDLDRVSEVDKFRAAREYLSAENDLVDNRQELAVLLDRFKVLLHVDTSVKLDVAELIPAPRNVDIDLERAVDAALASRLDLMTSRDRVDDAERHERNRERDVLPDLRLELVAGRADAGARRFRDVLPLERDSYGAGLSLEIPLDRVRERGALRAARIDVSRARRELTLSEDRVIIEVRDALRRLRSAESSHAIQEQITASEEKNVKIARLRFEEGTIGNRDLTDALSNLADAQDRLVREKTNVETARLSLMRAVGTLTINEDGTWRE